MTNMEQLTLVIPAKSEKESLPHVLEELKKFKLKIIIVLEENDIETINATKGYDCKIIYQKNKGYGSALIEGIKEVNTKFFSIFNADGSFNPNELPGMYSRVENENVNFIFASRYEKDCSSDDDTLTTLVGNYLFTKLGKILFGLKLTDILYTYVMGSTECFKKLSIQNKDFTFCVEFPIKAHKEKFISVTSKSNERARIGGIKKVSAIRDGFLILVSMIKLFLSR